MQTQPCHRTAQHSHWHNLLGATYRKQTWAETQAAKLLQSSGEPGFLPHTLGCPCHLVFSLPVNAGAYVAFLKHLGSSWITVTLWVHTVVSLPKHQGLQHHVGFTGHIISVGFSPLACCKHQSAAVHPSSFLLLTGCKAEPWEGAPLIHTLKQHKWAQLHKAAEDLAPLDSSFIWDYNELD